MSDPCVLFVKPKAIKPADKNALSAAGIIVVEVDDPQAVSFRRADFELSHSDMLACAAKAIIQSGATTGFGAAVAAMIVARHGKGTSA